MLFVTNRALQEGLTPATPLPRSVRFDLANTQAEQSVYFCRRTSADAYQEIGSVAFLDALKTSPNREILFYFHGYNNLPEPAVFPRAEELQRLFDRTLPGRIQVVPLIWPCDNDLGQIKDYYDDQMAADQSGLAFARMFQKFLTWREANSVLEEAPCTKRLHLLAHSMGNRVLRAAIARTVQYYLPQGMPLIFRNLFMVAADIGNGSFEPGEEGALISPAARNVVVYHAADDFAMRASKVANANAEEAKRQRQTGQIAARRLGHTGPADIAKVAQNIYSIDCDDFNNTFDPPTGHGYFGEHKGNLSPVFKHMCSCIHTGRVQVQATGGLSPASLRIAILNGTWRFSGLA
jgi:esterase/lipase superfamily enzyme